MALSGAARTNHEALFPGHVSSLAVTDPDLIEVFDNFAFDEVLRDTSLDSRTRLMVRLAALIACGTSTEYRVMLGAALTVGVTPVEGKEVVYQAVPYVGMGRLFDFLHTTYEVLTEGGIPNPLEGQSTTTPEARFARGLDVQKQIAGASRVDSMYGNAAADERHRQEFLSADCFGDYLTHRDLDIPTRELLTFTMLISLGGADPQANGRVAANLNVGNDRGTLLAVITALLPFVGDPRTLNALAAIYYAMSAGVAASESAT